MGNSTIERRDVIKMFNLPKEVKFCEKCVVSNQRPRIVLNEEGICNACEYAKRLNEIDWDQRGRELRDLCESARSKNGYYDVVVAASGGKDSSFISYVLKEEYNMHPLTVTWSPLKYTEVGWENYQNLIHSGFDNIKFTPNGKVARLLTKYCFEEYGKPFQAFIYGVVAFPLRVALQHKIPLVFYGENTECAYGGNPHNENSCKRDWDDVLAQSVVVSPSYWSKYGLSPTDLLPFQMPDVGELKKMGVAWHFMGYYKKWIPQENYYLAKKYTGFSPNPDGRSEGTYSKYASLDDRIDGFHFYLSYIKFGIGRATSDAAHEIRDGHLTREEGVRLVRKYDGEFPKKYFKEFLEYCDISEHRFWEIIDSWRSPHLWVKEDGQWKLRYQVS